jgi:hypothetical protein
VAFRGILYVQTGEMPYIQHPHFGAVIAPAQSGVSIQSRGGSPAVFAFKQPAFVSGASQIAPTVERFRKPIKRSTAPYHIHKFPTLSLIFFFSAGG